MPVSYHTTAGNSIGTASNLRTVNLYSLLLDRRTQTRYHIKHSPRRSPTLRGLHTGVHQTLAFVLIVGFGLPDFLWADTFNAIFTDKAVTRVQHGMHPLS